jgi:hypothetical protein
MVSMVPLIAVCHVQATILLKFALNTNQSINRLWYVVCLSPGQLKPKSIKLVFAASWLSMQY